MMRPVFRAALLIFLIAGTLHAQKYTVRLSPPLRAGQKFKVTASGKSLERNSLSMAPAPAQVQIDEYEVQFEATAEVLAVDTKGRPCRVAYTVEKFTKTQDG